MRSVGSQSRTGPSAHAHTDTPHTRAAGRVWVSVGPRRRLTCVLNSANHPEEQEAGRSWPEGGWGRWASGDRGVRNDTLLPKAPAPPPPATPLTQGPLPGDRLTPHLLLRCPIAFDQLGREGAGCAASSAQMALRPAEQVTAYLSHDLQCGGGELCSWEFPARASRKMSKVCSLSIPRMDRRLRAGVMVPGRRRSPCLGRGSRSPSLQRPGEVGPGFSLSPPPPAPTTCFFWHETQPVGS